MRYRWRLLGDRMKRISWKALLVALIASFALASSVDAAPRKTVRHRAKHSSRVSSSTSTTTTTHKRVRKHTTAARPHTTTKHKTTKPR